MIRLNKPDVPAVLRTRGEAETARFKEGYTADARAYDSGTKTFSFDSDIYGHPSVKETLVRSQHGKCAFCESKISHISFGDVEHFRPKAGYRQDPDDELGRPGYYWLVYDWANLLLACQLCNQRFKKNTFPLANPDERCRNHEGELAREQPLFLDPAREEPGDHIEWIDEQPRARAGSPRGRATIEALGLRREELREQRLNRLSHLTFIRDVARSVDYSEALQQRARAHLAEAVLDRGEYAAMARALLGGR